MLTFARLAGAVLTASAALYLVSPTQAVAWTVPKPAAAEASTAVTKVHSRRYHRERHYRDRYYGDRYYDDSYYEPRYYRHRHYRYGRNRIIDAPFAHVETGRRVIVEAPFASVHVGRYGRHIRAPFVDIWRPY